MNTKLYKTRDPLRLKQGAFFHMNFNTNVDILLIENKRLLDTQASLSKRLANSTSKMSSLKEIIRQQNEFLQEFETRLNCGLKYQTRMKQDLERIRRERDDYKMGWLRNGSNSSLETVKQDGAERIARIESENKRLKQQQLMLVKTVELLYGELKKGRSNNKSGDLDQPSVLKQSESRHRDNGHSVLENALHSVIDKDQHSFLATSMQDTSNELHDIDKQIESIENMMIV